VLRTLSVEQVEDLKQKVTLIAKESFELGGTKPNISENASFQQLAKQ